MKKKYMAILAVLFAAVLVMGGVLFYVIHLYRGTGLALVATFEQDYAYNGKLLLAEDKALLVKTLGKTDFEALSLQTLALDPFGFEGKSLSYYQYSAEGAYGVKHHTVITPDPAYEGLWPVMKPDRLIYVAEDGGKYCIHPKEDLCYPIFSDSIEGVDPLGTDVLAFSGNGAYALSLAGTEATVYHTDPMDDSLRVVDVKTVSLAKYGKTIRFGAFAGDTTAYFEGETGFFALDCSTGNTAPALLDPEGKYSEPINRVFAQRLDGEKGQVKAVWSHLLLGTERKSPVLEDFSSIRLTAVSPEGTYAVGEADGEMLVLSEKRAFSLSSVLEEGEEMQGVDFVYENLLFVHLKDSARCYKICF